LKEIGSWVYGADAKSGTNHFDVDLSGKITVVMGAEGWGIRRLVRDNCDIMIKIPTIGNVPSLNVSNAATIILSETYRQVSFGKSHISV
ncbi:MAG: TrmH family RNA methyltransferase, partial [Pseudomonadota bacterium]